MRRWQDANGRRSNGAARNEGIAPRSAFEDEQSAATRATPIRSLSQNNGIRLSVAIEVRRCVEVWRALAKSGNNGRIKARGVGRESWRYQQTRRGCKKQKSHGPLQKTPNTRIKPTCEAGS